MGEAALTFCANHPDRETGLRCNNCEKYICSECAVLTPTGYRCRECVRGQQKVFETAVATDYVVAFFVAIVFSAIGAWISTFISFFTIFLAPAAGTVIAEAVRLATSRRRSPLLFRVTVAGVVAGAAPLVLLPIFFMLTRGSLNSLFALIWPIVYVSLAASTTYYRLSGLTIRH